MVNRTYLTQTMELNQLLIKRNWDCKAAQTVLRLHLAEDRADIAQVQEPWLAGGRVFGLASNDYKLLVAYSEDIKPVFQLRNT